MSNLKKAKSLIRKLGLMPPNVLTPSVLADYFQKKLYALSGNNKLAGLNAVGGSKAWLGISSHLNEGKNNIAIVGKGITFDSGGMSIKPSNNMHHMKFDMLGAATVLGLELTLKESFEHSFNLYGCCAENTFHHNTMRPGDVLEYADGTLVEVIDTDAEGRLVLADGIIEAKKTNPSLIITIATLTGSARAALGQGGTALFSNEDDLAASFLESAKLCEEDVWRLPIWESHRKDIKGKKGVSDIKNLGTGAGASTAAAFLEHFVGDTPWIHLDIAGSAYKDETPTCVMLETITHFLKENYK